MAKTRDYMDYLDNEIGIAPANSQEEFQAAETIVELMKDHDLDPTIQEFDARPLGHLAPSILMVVMFVGVLLSGIGSTALRLIGFILAVVPAALLLVAHSGRPFLENLGPVSKSQNVIAVHRATGDKVTKGNRPIVIVAHYDTPHESALYGRLAQYQVPLKRASVPCVVVALVVAVTQVLAFLPGALRLLLWIAGLVACLPLVLLAVVTFTERFSPCTVGANDNKSSVAALLSVMDQVRPMDDRVSAAGGKAGEEDAPSDVQSTPEADRRTATYGVRHGREVLEELGVLPSTCEIVYEDVQAVDGGLYGDSPSDDGNPAVDGQVESYDAYEGDFDDDGHQADEVGGYVGESDGDQPESADEGRQDDATYDDDTYGTDEGDDADEWDTGAHPGDIDDANDAAYEEDWQDEQPYEDDEEAWGEPEGTSHAQEAKQGFGTKMRNAFRTLRERLASRKSADGIDIPRGNVQGDGDFSEFEETDWGEEDWSDGQYPPQDELRSINREEMMARRATQQRADEQEPAEDGPEGEAQDLGYETGYDEGAYEDEPYDDEGDVDIPYDEYDVVDGADEADGETQGDVANQDMPVVSRTSHDISHEDGPDWAVVEATEEEESGSEAVTFDQSVYDQDDDQLDDLYDLDSEELAEVEEELDDDQLAGESPQRRQEEPKATYEENPDELDDEGEYEDEAPGGDDGAYEDEPERAPEKDNQVQAAAWDQSLSWDDEDGGDTEEDGDDILPKDTRGLDEMSETYDTYEGGDSSVDQLDEPEPIDDPTWGQTTYEPPKPKNNVARRAMLYDVPSPSDDAVDPLASDEEESADEEGGPNTRQGRKDNWKGGAAIRSDLLDEDHGDGDDWQPADGYSEEDGYDDTPGDADAYGAVVQDVSDYQDEEGEAPYDEADLQDAILSMGDDLLVSHDIWFVAVGSSSVDHAGIKAFLSNFRQDIRGAFLINLDSIGAGVPTIITREGLHAGRRSDRRLVRLLSNVADDLHVSLQKAAFDWDDTDATPAMRARVRAVTIMGMSESGLPALSHTESDIPENVDPRQVSAIVRTITEVIRRS